MKRAVRHAAAGDWPEDEAVDAVTLDFDARHRRRIRLVTDAGAEVLLDLPRATAMAGGDGLAIEGGGWVRVTAAPEDLLQIRSAEPTRFARLAWHLGNRHVPAEIADGTIRIRPDHVLEAMLIGLGAEVTRVTAPFQPEGGAYSGGGGHHHHHHEDGHNHHDHGHHHDHGDHHDHDDDGHHHQHHH